MFRALRKNPTFRPYVERAIDFARMWPWVYPRGIALSTRDWVQRMHARSGWYASLREHWYEQLQPGGTTVNPAPQDAPPGLAKAFQEVASRRYPEAFVSHLVGARVVGDTGLVLTPDNRVLPEFHHQFGNRTLRQTLRRQPFAIASFQTQRLYEPVALLAAPEAWNHYHWLFDVLPRYSLLERWRPVIRRWLVSARTLPVQLESLQLLGLKKAEILPLSPRSHLCCQHLYAPSLPGSEGCTPPWVPTFLREKFLPLSKTTPGQGLALYLMRGKDGSRPVLNEDELVTRLKRYGFTAIDPSKLSFIEQVAAFRDAKLIVSAHGASLANIVFSTNATVVELFSADYPRVDCYFTLSRHLGHSYSCLLDPATASATKPWGALTADVAAVEKIVAL